MTDFEWQPLKKGRERIPTEIKLSHPLRFGATHLRVYETFFEANPQLAKSCYIKFLFDDKTKQAAVKFADKMEDRDFYSLSLSRSHHRADVNAYGRSVSIHSASTTLLAFGYKIATDYALRQLPRGLWLIVKE